MKKNILFTLLIFFTISGYSNKYLIRLNAEWLNQLDVNVKSIDFVPRDYNELIQKHLLLVEHTLRARSTDGLSESQKVNRQKCLDILHDYAKAGVFPTNIDYNYTTPIFVDHQNVYCAVGHIMKMTGYQNLADDIDREDEIVYVRNIKNPKAVEWMNKYGLTLDECAWIQPGYGGPRLTAHDYKLDLSGLTATTPIINREIPGSLDTFSAWIETVGTVPDIVADSNGNVRFQVSNSGNNFLYLKLKSSYFGCFMLISDSSAFGPHINNMDSFMFNNANHYFLTIANFPNMFRTFGYPNYINYGFSVVPDSILGNSRDSCSMVPLYDTSSIAVYPSSNYVSSHTTTNFRLRYINIFSPLTLSDVEMKLTPTNGGVSINWSCTINSETEHFDIEHSVDGAHWEKISSKYAPDKVENLKNNFNYLHTGINEGIHYYRLQEYDKYGIAEYHPVMSILLHGDINPQGLLTIIGSNIVTDELKIYFEDVLMDSPIEMFNESGNMMISKNSKNGNEAIVNTSGLAAGIYYIRMGKSILPFVKK